MMLSPEHLTKSGLSLRGEVSVKERKKNNYLSANEQQTLNSGLLGTKPLV